MIEIKLKINFICSRILSCNPIIKYLRYLLIFCDMTVEVGAWSLLFSNSYSFVKFCKCFMNERESKYDDKLDKLRLITFKTTLAFVITEILTYI